MDNVIDFQSAKVKKRPQANLLDEFDAQFSSLSTKEERELLKKVKAHFIKLDVKFVHSSKKVNPCWIKEYKPLLCLDKKMGFSFAVSKTLNLEDGWIMHPLKANTSEDLLLVINSIATRLQTSEDDNERHQR